MPLTPLPATTQQSRPLAQGTSNAYFLALSVQNIRCFVEEQVLVLKTADGAPARWTLILGDNGVGKTTLLQLLALGAIVERTMQSADGSLVRFRKSSLGDALGLEKFVRAEHVAARVEYRVQRTDSFVPGEEVLFFDAIEDGAGEFSTFSLDDAHMKRDRIGSTIVYGYGANRRRALRGLTAEVADNPAQTLFDDDATLRDPEEWLLQNELIANTVSPLQERARRQRDKVVEILTRILPGIDEIRVATHADVGKQLRASLEVHGADGWIPFAALGLGYRTMTAWIVDFASRMFERYDALEDPLSGSAVCLVDEIDLHLHPRWQRDLIHRLSTLFPQTQFIATAHSPLIVQAAPDANVVVLRRHGDTVVIDSAPRSVRKWRVDQILTSELFDLESARSPELDAWIRERDEILAKPTLTEQDEQRLVELREKLGDLPYGDTPEDIEAMDVIRQAAKALRGKQAP